MLWEVVSSARCVARNADNPVLNTSAITHPQRVLGGYRLCGARLERTGGNTLPHLVRDGDELPRVVRVRGVAATLQRVRKCVRVAAGVQCGRVARVVANQ